MVTIIFSPTVYHLLYLKINIFFPDNLRNRGFKLYVHKIYFDSKRFEL